MLEHYYLKPESIDRIRHDWLGKPIEQYVSWLHDQQYSPRSIYRRVPTLMHFSEFCQSSGVKAWNELPNHVDSFLDKWKQDHPCRSRKKEARQLAAAKAVRVSIQQMLCLLLPEYPGHLRKQLPKPFLQQAPDFFPYLQDERGLRENTIKSYCHNLRRFESYLRHINLHELNQLSPTVLSAFVTQSSQELCKNTLKCRCENIRIFLRYLHREGVTPHDLSISLDMPRVYRFSTIPRSISWGEVRQMFEAVDRRTPIGKRDYAILLLLVTYGLRSAEVAALSIDSIDWENERLRVPERKAGHSTAFPLSPIVGEAIVSYLQHGRQESTERALFLRSFAPFTPLRWQAIGLRATHYLKKADIQVARPGSHTLRHTCVQRLVDAHFSLKTIGDYVGHSVPISTQIYTKIDVEALREIASGDGEDIL